MKNLCIVAILLFVGACKNKDINEGEAFRPRPIQDNFDDSHFTKVPIDGVEYLMMERDNNNPHEGFGFMAFRANKLMERQDSMYAHLKAMQYFQNKIYAQAFALTEDEAQQAFDRVFAKYLSETTPDLIELEKEELSTGKTEGN